MPDRRPIRALLDRTGGGPQPGRPALVVADQGVGKTALLVHAALEGLAEDRRVLHVALTDPVERVRAWYDEIARSLRSVRPETAPNEVGVERRRMILSYAERPFDPVHLGAQLRMLKEVAQFDADLLILDGLDADRWLEHGEALSRLSGDLGMAAWFAVSSPDGVVRSVGTSAFVVRLALHDRVMRLHLVVDARDEELPWWLDPATNLLGEGASEADDQVPPKASGCTLYSGGASGAEEAFGVAAERFAVREVAFTFEGHRQARTVGSKLLSAWELEAGDVSLVYVSRRLHRSYNENGLIRRVLQTLWHMVSRSQQVFVIGAIQEDGTVVGGTGWSVELARMWEKDLWVFDQERRGWFHWEHGQWVPGDARITAAEICGTGTRYLEDSGRMAIDALFAEAFGAAEA